MNISLKNDHKKKLFFLLNFVKNINKFAQITGVKIYRSNVNGF